MQAENSSEGSMYQKSDIGPTLIIKNSNLIKSNSVRVKEGSRKFYRKKYSSTEQQQKLP